MEDKKIINGIQYSVVAIIFKKEKVLMFRREGEDWETGWEFIKGAMHFGETEEEAVLREIDEESSVNVNILGKLPQIYWDQKPFKGGFLKIHASVFACEYVSGDVTLGELEHKEWKWMDLKEAMDKVWLKHGAEGIKNAYEIYLSTKQ